tara:strand:- start:14249 stop:16381 length:2133 start_codon:yes stop_codon:yes gene_type:complete
MKIFLKLIISAAGFILLFTPVFQSSQLFGFKQVDNSGQEVLEKDLEYLQNLNERADEQIISGEMDSIRYMVDEALTLAEIFNDREEETQAYINLGSYFLNRNLPDSVFHYLTDPYERLKDTSNGLRLGNIIANAYARSNNPTASLILQEELLQRAREEENTYFSAGLTQNMGNNYRTLGDLNTAIEHYLISLEMAEELEDSTLLAVILDNLGRMNTDLENLEIAETYISQALEIAKSIGNLRNQLTSHLNLGIVQNMLEKYEASENNFNRVIEISEQLGNIQGQVQGLYNLGDLYKNMGNYELALRKFEESLLLGDEYNIAIARYYNQRGKANVYFEQDDYTRAISLYTEALQIAEELASDNLIVSSNRDLFESYERSGDTLNAYPFLKRYSVMQDSLKALEQEQAVARQEVLLGLRTERETRELTEQALEQEQQGRMIITFLLVLLLFILAGLLLLIFTKIKDNKQLEAQKKELIEANEVKDQLLSVLSHDLRTPITSIQGVIQLIRSNLIGEAELNSALNQIEVKLQKEMNTLTNYLQWAKNQKDGFKPSLSVVNLSKVIVDVISDFEKVAINKNISIENHLPDKALIYADKHMVYVILRNLLSNALKYTPKSGKVLLGFTYSSDRAVFSIEDNGEGVPPENYERIFDPFHTSNEGTDGEIGTGLGLSICKDFAQIQGASIYFESEIGKGTTFFIDFKVPPTQNDVNS